jgi:peroxiredoxin
VNPRLRKVLLLLVALAVAALVLVPLFRSSSHNAGPAALAGTQPPVIALTDDHGHAVSLDRYRGKIVVMNLWATWCPPCRAEMPDLQRVYAQYAKDGVVVIGVNQGESAQRAAAFATALGITFPIWLDQDQRYGRAYGALGLPTTVIVGRDGTIVRGFDGALTIDQMRAAIAPLVGAHA